MIFPGKRLQRFLLFIIPIMIGIAILFFLVKNRSDPPRKQNRSNERTVRVIELAPVDVIPKTVGFGTARPVKVWQAIAEVSGKAIYVNPLLKKGQRIKKDTLLVEIDPTEYKLSVANAETRLRSIKAQVKQLRDKETSNQALLELELSALELKKKELERQKKLLTTDITTRSVYEQAEATYIAQQYKVQSLKNTLNSLESEYELLEAEAEQARINKQSAQLQLKYTKIHAPFDSVISSVNVEQSQFVQKGQTVAEADSVDAVEIEAQISGGLNVFRPQLGTDIREKLIEANSRVGEVFGLSAVVRTTTGRIDFEYPARVMRFNVEIDRQTRTPGVIVQVDDPFSMQADHPKRPLIKGMYCEVELRGQPFKNSLIIPRTALHKGDTVYLVDENNQLRFRIVKPGFAQDGFIMIRSGLKTGDRLVITDVIPAVEGMKLSTMIDSEVMRQMILKATGGKP